MLTLAEKADVYEKYKTFTGMSEAEKAAKWLEAVLLPKFFDKYRGEIMDQKLAYLLQTTINDWQRDAYRPPAVKITVEYINLEIVVKVDNVTICTFN